MSHPMLSIKLQREKLGLIDELVRGGLFASRSEVVRASIRRMAGHAMLSTGNMSDQGVKTDWQQRELSSAEEDRLVSVSIKVPAQLLSILDQALSYCSYTSRSLFVRDALDRLLFSLSGLLENRVSAEGIKESIEIDPSILSSLSKPNA